MQKIAFLENTSFTDKPNIDLMLDNEYGKEIRICMQNGTKMAEHAAPGAIVIMTLSGTVEISSAEGNITLKTGEAVYFGARISHSLIATEDSIIRLSLSKLDSIKRVEGLII